MTTVDDLLNYVQETPNNINPRVFKMMANELSNSGSDSIKIYNGVYDGDSIVVNNATFKNVYDNNDKLQIIVANNESESKENPGFPITTKYNIIITTLRFNSFTSKYNVGAMDEGNIYEAEGNAVDTLTLTIK